MSDYQFNPDQEQWKAIPGYPGYEVSDQGRIKSYKYPADMKTNTPRIIKVRKSRGYFVVTLWKEGKPFTFGVHRLVLLAFVGPCPPGNEGCHGDGNRVRNHLDNLRWDTKKGNGADVRRHGSLKGTKHPAHKLTEFQVIQIREMAAQGISVTKLGKIFSVTPSCISQIKLRQHWRHI